MAGKNWVWGTLWLALGCGGKVVDLGGNAVDLGGRDASGFADAAREMADAMRPQTLYESEVRAYGIGANDTTLYALLDTTEELGQLVSCPLDRCRSERTILATGVQSPDNSPYATPIIILGDWLYWRYGGGSPANGVAACPNTGCDRPEILSSTFASDLVTDAAHLYWIDFDGRLVRWRAGEASATLLVTLGYGAGPHLTVAAGHVYFTDGEGKTISRIAKDGSGTAEVLALGDHVSSVGLSAETLYFTSKILAGSVRACPSIGCQGEGTPLVSNQRWPASLSVAGDDAFWVNQIGERNVGSGQPLGALLSCRLPDCVAARTWATGFVLPDLLGLTDFEASSRFVITSHFVLWLERAGSFGSGLRRLPR